MIMVPRQICNEIPGRRVKIMAGVIGLVCFITLFANAGDLPGAKDHASLKRFGGSEIVGYDTKRFDAFTLQTATFKRYNFDTKKREYAKAPLNLEGSVTRIWYESAGEASSAELAGNYRNELAAEGFNILYDSAKDPHAKSWSGFLNPFGNIKIKTNRSNYVFLAADQQNIHVLSARKKRPDGDLYVCVTTVEWGKNDSVYKAKKGAYAAVDIIRIKPMKQNMVVIKADEMASAIFAEGRVALYGIYFDSNKATLKPESKATLIEIASLLKQSPTLALHVVGHTDNVGGFDFNLDLSKRRAQAVTAALVNEHNIAAARLTSNGVAYLAPVSPNTSEQGRAKNRRVELVPR